MRFAQCEAAKSRRAWSGSMTQQQLPSVLVVGVPPPDGNPEHASVQVKAQTAGHAQTAALLIDALRAVWIEQARVAAEQAEEPSRIIVPALAVPRLN